MEMEAVDPSNVAELVLYVTSQKSANNLGATRKHMTSIYAFFYFMKKRLRSRDSSVGIATVYRLDGWGLISIFISLQRPSYPMDTVGSLAGGKAAGP
jgi:hypothetical protein